MSVATRELKESERGITDAMGLLIVALLAGQDDPDVKALDDNPAFQGIIENVEALVDASARHVEVARGTILYLAKKAEFTNPENLGDDKLVELRTAYAEGARAHLPAMRNADPRLQKAMIDIIGGVTPYVAALETTVAALRADLKPQFRVDL